MGAGRSQLHRKVSRLSCHARDDTGGGFDRRTRIVIMLAASRRVLTMVLGCIGAYCAIWPIQREESRWLVFIILALLMVAFWIADAIHDSRSSAAQRLREQQEDAGTREIQRHLREQVPNEGTLKARTLTASMRVYTFLWHRSAQEPEWLAQMQDLSGEPLKDVYFRFGEFHAETLALYQQRFGRSISTLAEELFAAGVLTRQAVVNVRNCDSDLFLNERVVQVLTRAGQALPD
jgi:hypothetical protein